MNNPLISLEGFDYLLDISKRRLSKDVLNCLLKCLYPFSPPHLTPIEEPGSKPKKRKNKRKLAQYSGILEILEEFPKINGGILEIGCGSGNLSHLLAERGRNRIVGIDINPEQVKRLQRENELENLSFKQIDLFASTIFGEYDLVLGLHCCGNLTDKVLDTAVQNSSDVLCVPCCYGKINKRIKVFPKSMELSRRTEEMDYLINRVRYLEGYVDGKEKSVGNILLELYRRLIDFDRLFYLKENGYESYFREITGRKIQSKEGKEHITSSLRSAIIGIK